MEKSEEKPKKEGIFKKAARNFLKNYVDAETPEITKSGKKSDSSKKPDYKVNQIMLRDYFFSDAVIRAAIQTDVDNVCAGYDFELLEDTPEAEQQKKDAEELFYRDNYMQKWRNIQLCLGVYDDSYQEVQTFLNEGMLKFDSYIIETPSITIKNDKKTGEVDKYIQKLDGKTVARLEPSDVIHYRFNAFGDRDYGLSLVSTILYSGAIRKFIEKYNGAIFQNHKPRGVWTFPGDMSEDMYNDNVELIIEGKNDPQKDLFLRGTNIKYESFLNQKDVDFQKGYIECRNEILIGLGVPPIMMSLPGDSNKANSDVQLQAYDRRVIAKQNSHAYKTNTELLPRLGFDKIKFVCKKASKRDEERELNIVNKMKGLVTLNEAREQIGYPAFDIEEYPQADEIWSDGNSSPDTESPVEEKPERKIEKSLKKKFKKGGPGSGPRMGDGKGESKESNGNKLSREQVKKFPSSDEVLSGNEKYSISKFYNSNFEDDIKESTREDLNFFDKESDKWVRGSDYEAKQNAYDYVTRDFPELGDKLRSAAFKKNTPEKVLIYRVGALRGITSFFPSEKQAKSYSERLGVDEVDKYEVNTEEIIPTFSGSGELWVNVDITEVEQKGHSGILDMQKNITLINPNEEMTRSSILDNKKEIKKSLKKPTVKKNIKSPVVSLKKEAEVLSPLNKFYDEAISLAKKKVDLEKRNGKFQKAVTDDLMSQMDRMFSQSGMGVAFATFIQSQYMDAGQKVSKKIGEAFQPNQDEITFLRDYNLDMVKSSSERELANIKRVLEVGFINNQSATDIKKALDKIRETAKDHTKTLVRTEMNRANNMGSLNAMQGSKAPVKKYLVITNDNRTSEQSKKFGAKYGTPEKAIGLDKIFKITYKNKVYSGQAPPFMPNDRDVLTYTL